MGHLVTAGPNGLVVRIVASSLFTNSIREVIYCT